MNVSAYHQLLNFAGPLDPTAGTLRALQQAHLLAVPFENLDIHLGRPISLLGRINHSSSEEVNPNEYIWINERIIANLSN